MKNGSSRGPANTCMPRRVPSTVLIGPVTAGVDVGDRVFIAPATGGATGPRTSTCWLAPVPLKVTWMTLSSLASPSLSILNW